MKRLFLIVSGGVMFSVAASWQGGINIERFYLVILSFFGGTLVYYSTGLFDKNRK